MITLLEEFWSRAFMSNKVVRVITAITGDSVAVCRDEIRHAQEHFMLPNRFVIAKLS